ncbi:MAG: MtN3 and saliva related transmembrane protein [Parcubacteria group bacterium GW2011_GWC1_39_29]|uniref:MtN3 and saliva related transmembrane protein n=1 Tax=Candidatus Yanofskybacteria bacterium GW2011_GWD1_39_16 TaxID=1619030 RepID=A0A837HT32_9BACT|nr:MAG: MtN3 and saliva related transmembrane protein [Candidatus Yanofskybacteria bacterium GW2011_GWD1_39_16]KKR14004.1 MAG: MtN3 and saliva related transmembrane protein [Parcubacteria group bacterium GW2011_GWC1_39_29]
MKHESILHPARTRQIADNLIYLGGILGPIVTIPQLIEIWLNKNASGVSVISWIAYLVGAMFWLFYGLVHREKPIIFTYGVWIVIDILIVIGTIIYS